MSASELNKGEPILRLLAPASADTTSLSKPAKGALNHPAPRRMPLVFRDRLRQSLASPPAMADVALIVGLRCQLMNISRVIGFIKAQVLLACGTFDHHREDKVIQRPFIMLISTTDVKGKRCAPPVNQDMHLGSTLAPVCGIGACLMLTQWSRNSFTIGSLPLPSDTLVAAIEASHAAEQLVKDALSLPGLEALMEDAAGDTEPVLMYCIPLAASPQDVPDAVDDGAVVCTWTAWPLPLRRLGQVLFESTPQRAWHPKIVNILWFCAMLIGVQSSPRGMVVLHNYTFPRGVSFFQGILFFG
jgi:hypothetical protein